MTVTDAIKGRYSVRGYLPDEVPEGLLREIFDIARLAPSNSNTQPWHVAIVSGEARERLSAAILAEVDAGTPESPGFERARIHDEYRDRRRACGFSYYETMGVERDDIDGRRAIARKNFEFFGAPHVAFFSMPKSFERINALDVGILLQSVMLVLAERGIGCIAQGALASYPGPVREIAEVPVDNHILCGLSFGYEDLGAHINTVRMPREPLETVTSFTR